MIAVLTVPVRQKYLAATLAGIDSSAGDTNKVVVADSYTGFPVPPGWRLHLAPKPPGAARGGNKWSTWAAFRLAAAAGEDLLFFEDDISLCKNAVAYIEQFAVPEDVFAVSFFTPYGDLTMPSGIWRHITSNFSYCQALKLPLRTTEALVDASHEMEGLRTAASDEAMREIGGARNWLTGYHYPGIVQHVGAESAVGNGLLGMGDRVSRSIFPDADAMNYRTRPGTHNFYR